MRWHFYLFHTLAPVQLHAQGFPGGLFQQVLNNPDDSDLNISFATRAEANGDLRHALAAYERLLHADPQNARRRARNLTACASNSPPSQHPCTPRLV